MTLPAEARDRYLAVFERVAVDGRGRPAWLRRLRDEAKERFVATGFPGVKNEDWKYTSVAGIEEQAFESARENVGGLTSSDISGYLPGDAAGNVLVFENGRYRADLSVRRLLPAGVHLGSLSEALSGEGDVLVPFFSRSPANTFTDLNTMLMEDGVFLHVGKEVEVPEPIHLLFLTSGGERPVMAHPRNVIVAGEGSRVTVVERYAGLSDAGCLVNAVTDIAAGRSSTVVHYRLQEDGPDAYHIASLRARQGTGSRFAAHSVSLGARLSRSDVHAVLDGEGAACLLNGLYLGNGEQHVDHFTTIDHAKPEGSSREYYRGILDGRSRGVFRGRVIVRKDAQKTDARQANRNLLLSREAEADSRPQLEIHADDVKCTHGATVGPLDEEKVFYMRSRGIDESSARGLLAYAFAVDILRRFDLPDVRRTFEEKLLAWLPDAGGIREFLHEPE
ncbi:Fe-S cluster assembly protein SufD [Candidatus Deferrimicrobium sp.]|uniref:Fe-S cluster assembly protein SufD n=1 Tax=Candidatus Deferrimicrobium sp. TaxID=3060586 RepID=UPI0027163685|nr:Fe-S cluster assembly protein SufD [Candidatus Deferrimicrobium sp.]MDO8738580.1 Fe-S cluster assembly protein SufD [Candidatus Deferrimicrobium sp.]